MSRLPPHCLLITFTNLTENKLIFFLQVLRRICVRHRAQCQSNLTRFRLKLKLIISFSIYKFNKLYTLWQLQLRSSSSSSSSSSRYIDRSSISLFWFLLLTNQIWVRHFSLFLLSDFDLMIDWLIDLIRALMISFPIWVLFNFRSFHHRFDKF